MANIKSAHRNPGLPHDGGPSTSPHTVLTSASGPPTLNYDTLVHIMSFLAPEYHCWGEQADVFPFMLTCRTLHSAGVPMCLRARLWVPSERQRVAHFCRYFEGGKERERRAEHLLSVMLGEFAMLVEDGESGLPGEGNEGEDDDNGAGDEQQRRYERGARAEAVTVEVQKLMGRLSKVIGLAHNLRRLSLSDSEGFLADGRLVDAVCSLERLERLALQGAGKESVGLLSRLRNPILCVLFQQKPPPQNPQPEDGEEGEDEGDEDSGRKHNPLVALSNVKDALDTIELRQLAPEMYDLDETDWVIYPKVKSLSIDGASVVNLKIVAACFPRLERLFFSGDPTFISTATSPSLEDLRRSNQLLIQHLKPWNRLDTLSGELDFLYASGIKCEVRLLNGMCLYVEHSKSKDYFKTLIEDLGPTHLDVFRIQPACNRLSDANDLFPKSNVTHLVIRQIDLWGWSHGGGELMNKLLLWISHMPLQILAFSIDVKYADSSVQAYVRTMNIKEHAQRFARHLPELRKVLVSFGSWREGAKCELVVGDPDAREAEVNMKPVSESEVWKIREEWLR